MIFPFVIVKLLQTESTPHDKPQMPLGLSVPRGDTIPKMQTPRLPLPVKQHASTAAAYRTQTVRLGTNPYRISSDQTT